MGWFLEIGGLAGFRRPDAVISGRAAVVFTLFGVTMHRALDYTPKHLGRLNGFYRHSP
ncbi:hypothetical protein [Neisseria musculi]|uniref:hypothetical protein n=1 Tax=Neisseria musculi TaxID=1815583 RepID=UPI00164C1C7A|nr:hypothetical protein [Neisseria musculi]